MWCTEQAISYLIDIGNLGWVVDAIVKSPELLSRTLLNTGGHDEVHPLWQWLDTRDQMLCMHHCDQICVLLCSLVFEFLDAYIRCSPMQHS